jgi:acetyltransferase-like isoleucine patch superfamily enzyme
MTMPAKLILLTLKIWRNLWMYIQFPLFIKCGRNVKIGYGCQLSHECIELGDDVYIGPGATFMSGISIIRIGNKVMFGPNVTIMGGDHRTNVIGSYMYDVKEKMPENDRDVVIEDDVWIGANALILKGVTIGRGSIIGAGSIVVKNVPPYSIYVGSPPMKIRSRWDNATIAIHEHQLQVARNMEFRI